MEVGKYEEWSLRVHQEAAAHRIPISGTVELTRRCNQNCLHCYNRLPLADRGARRSELTVEEHCRILDQISEGGCLWLLYTGGEPFARGDFPDIYTYAVQKGLLITLFTNGTLITPQIADHLLQWRPFSIEITIYGYTRETHERITGITDSYDRCMQAIGLLVKRGLPLKLKTMALKPNLGELWDMKRFVEQDFGLEFKFDAMINPRVDRSRNPLAVRLTPEEVVRLDLMDRQRAMEWRRFDERYRCSAYCREHADQLYQCGGGISSFAIDPRGMLSLCILSRNVSYDLLKGSFQEGWEHFLREVRQEKTTRGTKCSRCGIKAMCGMCPSNAELENGDAEEPIDFFCQVAHLRAYALDIPIPAHGHCEYCKGGSRYDAMMRTVEDLRAVSNG